MSRMRTGLKAWTIAAALVVLCGCQATQQQAREQATRRWNVARAQVKAQLAGDQFAAGHVEAAAIELSEAQRLHPDNTELIPLQARIWLAQGRLGDAERLLTDAELEGVAQAESLYLLGVIRQQQQQWSSALDLFEQAAALNADEVTYLVAATQTRLQLGPPAAALDTLEQAAPRFGWTGTYQAALAECYEQMGNWDAAALTWERVAADATADEAVRQRLAHALYRAGRFEDAATILGELVSDAAAHEAELLLPLMIHCQLEAGQATAARQQAEELVRRHPADARALRLLAHTLAQAGDHEAALRSARRALAQDAGDTLALELCTALAWHTGRHSDSVKAARRLVALDHDNPVAQHVLNEAPLRR